MIVRVQVREKCLHRLCEFVEAKTDLSALGMAGPGDQADAADGALSGRSIGANLTICASPGR
jgi:hypothetical protein